MLIGNLAKAWIVHIAVMSGDYKGELLGFRPVLIQRTKPYTIVFGNEMCIAQMQRELVALATYFDAWHTKSEGTPCLDYLRHPRSRFFREAYIAKHANECRIAGVRAIT